MWLKTSLLFELNKKNNTHLIYLILFIMETEFFTIVISTFYIVIISKLGLVSLGKGLFPTDLFPLPSSRRPWPNDNMTVVLSYWPCHHDLVKVALSLWPCQGAVVTVTLSQWPCHCEKVTVTLYYCCWASDNVLVINSEGTLDTS